MLNINGRSIPEDNVVPYIVTFLALLHFYIVDDETFHDRTSISSQMDSRICNLKKNITARSILSIDNHQEFIKKMESDNVNRRTFMFYYGIEYEMLKENSVALTKKVLLLSNTLHNGLWTDVECECLSSLRRNNGLY